jgi:hypothetical protein
LVVRREGRHPGREDQSQNDQDQTRLVPDGTCQYVGNGVFFYSVI